jgi:hypothetical protein
MDNKKFEQLIDLIINENEEKARELFHEIVVEKSREIYESIMDEEMMGGMGDGSDMVGEVGDLAREISAEEAGGMVEDDMGDDMGDDTLVGDEEVVDIDADDLEGGEGGMEEIEDAVVRIEDKLDQLMAEFEELMGDEGGEEDFGGEEGEEDFGDEGGEEGEEDFGGEEGEEEVSEEVMEAIQLKQIGGKTYNTFGKMGDNGDNTKSIALNTPKVKVPGVEPTKFSGHSESVPTGPKNPSNPYTKGETQVKHAGQFKNAPAQASQDLEKAPAPKHGDDGSNTKSPLGESRKIVKKKIVR